MGKRAGGRDFAPRVRSAVSRVLECLEEKGDLDALLMDAMQKDLVGTLSALAKYAPQQIDMAVENAPIDTTSLSPDILHTIFEERRRIASGADPEVH